MGIDMHLVGLQMDDELMFALTHRRLRRFEGVTHDGRHIDPTPIHRHQPAVDAAHVHQVIHQRHHVLHLALHHQAHALGHRGVGPGRFRDVQPVTQRCERIAQFVGQDGDELVLAAARVLESYQRCSA
jgi:hypothetical protein